MGNTRTDGGPAVTIAGYVVHEVADMFPLIVGQEFEALVEDIRLHGQMEPIVLDRDGLLIDGRNRGRACDRLGITPATKVYNGKDVTQYVVSHNLHRRHLTDGQRAMIAAKLATRQPGQYVRGQMHDIGHLPPSSEQAAEMLSVARNQVTVAKQILRDGVSELQALVAEGSAPVNTAARVATTLGPDEQLAYVAEVRSGADPVKAAPPDLKQAQARTRRGETSQRDAFLRNTQHIQPEKVIENVVGLLEGVASSLLLVKGITPTLDAEKRLAWFEALREPLSAINTLKKELAS
jgi:hypothetical protein